MSTGSIPDDAEEASHVFIPVQDGWLQLAIPGQDAVGTPTSGPASSSSSSSASDSARERQPSAFSGQILTYLRHGTTAARDAEIDAATSLSLRIELARGPSATAADPLQPRHAELKLQRPKGQLRGFLFAAETSPTGHEALPSLLGGSAATRDIPIFIDDQERPNALLGSFTWSITTKSTLAGGPETRVAWQLELPSVGAKSDPAPSYAWLKVGRNPFITNHPLTRGLPSSPEPCQSRGLVPRLISGGLELRSDPGDAIGVLPTLKGHLGAEVGKWAWVIGDFDEFPAKPEPSFRNTTTLVLPTLAGVELAPLPRASTSDFKAALRYDLPVLDELFAWSDPPQEQESNGSEAPAPNELAERTEPPRPATALEMDRLQAVWQRNLDRVALTRTEAAFATGWLDTDKPPRAVKVEGLVRPYRWSATFGVGLKSRLFGEYRLADAASTTPTPPIALDAAAVGLGGVLSDADVAARFAVSGPEIRLDPSAGEIPVTGFAAGLFSLGTSELLWDSGGDGLAAAPAPGPANNSPWRLRAAGDQQLKSGAILNRAKGLLTLTEPVAISPEAIEDGWPLPPLRFFARDLPVTETATDLVFNGLENKLENEARVPEALTDGLHEWRLFALQSATPGELSRRYDVDYGPFAFQPLRLETATFAKGDDGTAGHLTMLSVVGTLSTGQALSVVDTDEAPFGPEDAYRRGDLFRLLLQSDDGTSFEARWEALRRPEGSDSHRLSHLKPRKPSEGLGIRFATCLRPTATGDSHDCPIPAVVDITPAGKEAKLDLRLFGNDYQLEMEIEDHLDDGVVLRPKGGAMATGAKVRPAERARVMLLVDELKVIIRATDPGSSSVRMGTRLCLIPADGGSADEALLLVGEQDFRWLEIESKPATFDDKAHKLFIDHDSGRVEARFRSKAKVVLDGSPCFGLKLASPGSTPDESYHAVSGQVHGFTRAHRRGAGLTKLDGIELSAAWARIDPVDAAAPAHRIEHVLSYGATPDAPAEHLLRVSWRQEVTSRLRWLAGGLLKGGTTSVIEETASGDDWLTPRQSGEKFTLAREVLIDHKAGDILIHRVKLRLNRQPLNADRLRVFTNDSKRHVTVVDEATGVPVGLQFRAPVEHRLTLESDTSRTMFWRSLDQVTLTTPNRMLKLARETLAFAPRYVASRFRGKRRPKTSEVPHAGIAQLRLAGAGWLDDTLCTAVWDKAVAEGLGDLPILVGSSISLFPMQHSAAPLISLSRDVPVWSSMVPWLTADDGFELELAPPNGIWRVAAPDLWSASTIDLDPRGTLTPRPVIADRPADELGAWLDNDTLDCMHVEQSFVDWPAGTSPGLAPPFLRATLALYLLWRQAGDDVKTRGEEWPALTVHASRSGGIRLAHLRDGEAATLSATPAADSAPVDQLPADLVVLSRRRITRVRAFQYLPEVIAREPDLVTPATLTDRAITEDRGALHALRIVELPERAPMIVGAPVPLDVDRLDRSLPAPHGGSEGYLPRSPALGWPSDVRTAGLAHLALALGEELPVMSANAGFSARFQRFGATAWAPTGRPASAPALTADERPSLVDNPPESVLLSFRSRPIFDPGSAAHFEGPSARELTTLPGRVRVPATGDAPPQDQGDFEPILPPQFERATIGQRPGVLHEVAAAVTVPADAQGLDRVHRRFGRPGSTGPAVAHRLRSPRSPVLPPDPICSEAGLAVRRRTYLSLADCDSDRVTTGQGSLAPFRDFPGNADVLRLKGKTGHWRVAFRFDVPPQSKPAPECQPELGPNWCGTLKVQCEAVTTVPRKESENEEDYRTRLIGELEELLDLKNARAQLTIGIAAYPLSLDWTRDSEGGVSGELELKLTADNARERSTFETQRAAATQGLREATVDTPLRLGIDFPKALAGAAASGASPPLVPRIAVSIGLMLTPSDRRVLPIRVRTLAFGDPSYDRQLASKTKSSIVPDGEKAILMATDRMEYNPASTLYLAVGLIDKQTGHFEESADTYKLELLRVSPLPDGKSSKTPLKYQPEGSVSTLSLKSGTPVEIALPALRVKQNGTVPGLRPKDRLVITATLTSRSTSDPKKISLDLGIVSGPLIAPSPAVYSLIAKRGDDRADVPLHASAPLGQRVDVVDLKEDLALGQVRRRALFLWRFWSAAADDDSDEPELHLVKFDRSGGAQLPPGED
jgi:hypothetical protein